MAYCSSMVCFCLFRLKKIILFLIEKRWTKLFDVWKRSFSYELQALCYKNYIARIEREIEKLTCGNKRNVIFFLKKKQNLCYD